MSANNLFPHVEPYESGQLLVDDIHLVYWEQSGNPDGMPVLFLHGGPGGGATANSRRFFDPKVYRIVVFDQRGCGRSKPLGELRRNTTKHLVNDIEQLRRHLNIPYWVLFGGSWGSSLALAYSEKYPDKCVGLIMRGIFLCRRHEIKWFLTGMGRFFPEAHKAFIECLPLDERIDILANYYRRLINPNPKIHLAAAKAWSNYENSCSTLLPSGRPVSAVGDTDAQLSLARIEAHYFINNCFMEEGDLLANVGKIKNIPCVIVQGRYDVVCPIASATELADVWEGVDFQIIPDAGHSAMEPGICAALVLATERMKLQVTI